MDVARRLVAERLQHHRLLRRVREVVVAADHVGDPHFGVVDGDGEVVEGRAVAASDHEVVLGVVGEGDVAAQEIVDDGRRRRRGRAGGSPRPARREARPGSRGCRWRPSTRAPRRRSTGRGRRARTRAVARPPGRGDRAARTARRLAVPVELEPLERVDDLRRRSPESSARGRCPRCEGPSFRPIPGPPASCRARSARRRCGALPWAKGRSGLF